MPDTMNPYEPNPPPAKTTNTTLIVTVLIVGGVVLLGFVAMILFMFTSNRVTNTVDPQPALTTEQETPSPTSNNVGDYAAAYGILDSVYVSLSVDDQNGACIAWNLDPGSMTTKFTRLLSTKSYNLDYNDSQDAVTDFFTDTCG